MLRNILPALLALFLIGQLVPSASGQTASGQAMKQATPDLSHIYGDNYREIIEKYGDRPDMLSQKAAAYSLSQRVSTRLNLGRLAKGAAMTEDWILRAEAEPNNEFSGADDINDVLATAGWKKDGDGSSEFTGGQVSAALQSGDVDIFRFTVDPQKMYFFASTHSFTTDGADDLTVRARLFHESDVDTTVVEDFKGIAGNDQMSGDLLGRATDGRNGSDDFRITGWSAYVDEATGNLVEGNYYLYIFNDADAAGTYNLIAYAMDFEPLVSKFEPNQTNIEVLNGGLVSTLPDDGVARTFMAHNPDTVKVQSPAVPSASNAVFDQLLARGDEDVDNFLVNYKAGHTVVIETLPYFGWYRTPEGEVGPGGSRLTDTRMLLFDADYQNLLADDDDGARESMDGPNNINSRFFLTSSDMAARGITGDSPLWLSVMAWASKTRIALSGGSAADIAGRGVDNSDPGRFVYDVVVHQYPEDLVEANHEPNDSPQTAMSVNARADTVVTGNTAAAGDVDYFRAYLHETRMYTLEVPGDATVEIMHEFESDMATGTLAMTGDLLASGGFHFGTSESTSGGVRTISSIVPKATGAYLIKVTGASAGDYSMAIIDKGQTWQGLIANEPDNTESDALAQNALEVGPGAASRTGMILPAGDVDTHWFNANEGTDINLTLRPTVETVADFAGTMTLRDPSGTIVATAATSISHTAAVSGVFTISVQAADPAGVGFYLLSGGEPFTEKEPNNEFAQATPIALGQLYEANMGSGDTDYYQFTLEAGTLYSLRSFDNETGGALSVEFFDTIGGSTLMDDSGWPDNYSGDNFKIANFIPPATGTYYLKISGNPGAYKIGSRVNERFLGLTAKGEPNNSQADADARGAYQAFGTDVEYALFDASHPRWFGDEDWFRVQLTAGQTLTAETKPVEGLGGADNWNKDTDTRLVFFAADGVTELGNDDDGGNSWYSRLDYQAAADETVYVQVRTSRTPDSADDRSLNRGDYLLNIDVTSSEVEPNNDVAAAATNRLRPGVVNAAFDDTDQVDVYRLDLLPDYIYHVRTLRPEGGYSESFTAELVTENDPNTNLLDGTGYTTRYSGSNLKLNLVPDAATTYYLRITGAGNGAYQVAIKERSIADIKLAGEPNNSIAEAEALGAQPFEGPGEQRLAMLYNASFPWTAGADPLSARFGDDLDFYRYDLVAGDTLVAETAPADGPLWPRDLDMFMELYDAAGNMIDDNDDGGFDWHSKITYVAAESGTVYVLVRGQDFQGATDRDPSRGEYLYSARRLNGGAITIDTEEETLPGSFTLAQNYPNPFAQVTTVNYTLPKPGTVRLAVYNMLGQRVATLVDQQQATGEYSVQFNASGLASGMYLYRMETDAFVDVKTMTLIR